MSGWVSAGNPGNLPMIDPETHVPVPENHSGRHRFGISRGWQTLDCLQYQEVKVQPGTQYHAGFWYTHQDGTDEVVELLWIDGSWPGPECLLCVTATTAEVAWTPCSSRPFTPSRDMLTVVVRYRHLEPSGIASCHVDDIWLRPFSRQ
jgi:hypothetical protein